MSRPSPEQKLADARADLLAHQQRKPNDLKGIARLRRRVQEAQRAAEGTRRAA